MLSETVVGAFLEQAALRGAAPFLHRPTQSGWEPISWAEARERALRIAAGLVGAGVKPGEAVLILSENRVEWILADLGIQAAGAVTVPIYATSTEETIGKIVANSEAKVGFAGSEQLAGMLPHGLRVLDFDSDLPGWLEEQPPAQDREEVERRLAALRPSDVASIIYTSGTTGDPKGVVLPHSNFVVMARASLQDFEIGPADAMLSFLPLSHVFERQSGVVVAITSGCEIWLSHGIVRLAEDIAQARPTVMLGVPRMFEKIVDRIRDEVRKQPGWKRFLFEQATAGRLGPLGARVLAPVQRRVGGGRLRFFVSGGSPLAKEVEEFFWSLGIPIYNGWGMTETTSGATANNPSGHRYGTVGRALPGVELKLAEDGELLVKGPGVMREYHRDPRSTAETLENGWLRTGDLAEVDGDGYVRITDRKKDLLKTSNGKYVAPQPIEAKLQGTRYIETAVLIGDDRPYVTALLVPKWEHLKQDLSLDGEPDRLVRDERVTAAIQKSIDEVNGTVAHWEAVKYFRLLPRDFEESEGERTPSLKIKRSVVKRKNADLIEEMYEAGSRTRSGEEARA
ncbi:MAG: long-chain fatty acid--CoA ligase [Chloroflexi bacterium]|nr:MAG: long-chain fatty acid--CoA ligase [Chloroflexota bacterium]